jgi:hypothetical protein
MAIDKKMLQKFLDNPALVSAQDLDLDSSPDGSMDIPEVDPEADLVEQAPDIADPDEVNQENDLAKQDEVASIQPAAVDSDIIAKLKKLKAGESLDEESEQEQGDIASDMKAPIELRKKAMQKIKQKYLGQ